MIRSNPNQNCSERSGVAAVEFALCLPLLMLLVFGSIEAANAIYLRQAMTIAAYESVQVASAFGGTEPEAIARGEEILATFNVSNATIEVQPKITANIKGGTPITVTVEAPTNSNSLGPAWFFSDLTFQRQFTMLRL